ncbi:MAG: type II toxin-antitoxin system VapC family toxin [Rhodoglobus sp.]
MRVYMDSSALAKRSLDEPESARLEEAIERLAQEGNALLSSALTWIELTRTLRSRLEDEPPAEVAELVDAALTGVLEYPIDEQVVGLARRIGPSTLRSLDAIHLATATLLDVDLVCAYDKRLLQSASELGFRTISP